MQLLYGLVPRILDFQPIARLCVSELLIGSVANAVDVAKCVTLIEKNLDVSVQSASLPLYTNGDINGSSSSRGVCNSSAIQSLFGSAAVDSSSSDSSIV